MKNRVMEVVFCAVVCFASITFAQRTISVNLGTNGVASTIPNDNTAYAGVQSLNVTCDLWNNMSGNSETLSVVKSSTTNNCGASVIVTPAQAAWGPGSTSSRVNGHENCKLLGRYMDLSSANQYTVTVTNIPFARYKVYVILAGDGTGTYASMIVNGVNYCGSGNSTIPGTSSWGTRTGTWATLQSLCGDSYLKEGVNYLTVTNLFGTLIVKNAISANRATLAAIQIEEIPYAGIAWKGAGANNYWSNSTNWWNWPVTNQNISFVGTNRVTNTNDFTAGTTFSNVTFETSTGYGDTNWSVAGNSFNLSGNLALNMARTVTMSTPMAFQISPKITVANGGTMTLSGALSGAFGITKDGGGTLTYSVANSYSGPTSVTGGTLRVSSTLLNSSSFAASNGATLEFGAVNIIVGNHGTAVAASRVISADAARIYMNASMESRIGNVVLKNGSTWTSDRALTSYDVLIADNASGISTVLVSGVGASYMNGSGGVHLQGMQNFNVEDTTVSYDPDLIVSMIIASPGSSGGAAAGIRKQGAGTMALLNANTFNGALIIESGAVLVGTNTTAGTLGTGPVTNNATLVFNRSNDMIVNNVLAGSGTINQVGAGTLTLGGDNSAFSGTLSMTNGIVVPKHVNAFGAGTINLSGGIVDMRATGAIAPTRGITLSGTPTIRMSYNSAQDLTISSATGTTTLNVDVLDITQTGVYKLLNTSSDLGLGAFSLQLVNNTPGLTAILTSDAQASI